jgi:hypothetical protein
VPPLPLQTDGEGDAPSAFTSVFHLRYLPALLAGRAARGLRGLVSRKDASPFAGHVPLEYVVLPFVCLAAAALGASWAVPDRAGSAMRTLGAVLLAAGGLGLAAFTGFCIRERRRAGGPYSWREFEALPFLLCLLGGAHAGVVFAAATLSPFLAGLGLAAGVLAGYGLGLVVGYWLQALGGLVIVLRMAAGFGVVVVLLTDAILLSIRLLR